MPRNVRLVALLVALALVAVVPAAATAATQRGTGRVIANIGEAAGQGSTQVIAWTKADIHGPMNWADPPGYITSDAVNGTKFRSVVERVWFWPWWDERGNRASWAFVWEYQCPFTVDGPPTCTDVAHAFVDYRSPQLTDFMITCWWDGGVRPPGETWDICDAPNAHQNWTYVAAGSLTVQLPR